MTKDDKADIIQALVFIVTGMAFFTLTVVFALITENLALGVAGIMFLLLPALGVMILRGLQSGED